MARPLRLELSGGLYHVTARGDVPVSQQRLFIGRGFQWEQRHTHRLMQTYRPEFRRLMRCGSNPYSSSSESTIDA